MGTGLVSPAHVVILLLVVLLVFGAKRLPELGRSLGSGMREFKDSVTGDGPEPQAAIPPPAEDERGGEGAEPALRNEQIEPERTGPCPQPVGPFSRSEVVT
jgi:sec-independent protein translocase protein TatA